MAEYWPMLIPVWFIPMAWWVVGSLYIDDPRKRARWLWMAPVWPVAGAVLVIRNLWRSFRFAWLEKD